MDAKSAILVAIGTAILATIVYCIIRDDTSVAPTSRTDPSAAIGPPAPSTYAAPSDDESVFDDESNWETVQGDDQEESLFSD